MSTVLIVDEDSQVRTFLHSLLAKAGFTVKEASGSQEAIDHFHRGKGIDLVLLDLDELATLAALRQVEPAVRCCILAQHLPAEGLPGLDVLTVFAKPILNPAQLVHNIRQLCHVPVAQLNRRCQQNVNSPGESVGASPL